jgi:MoxR-like ATPase
VFSLSERDIEKHSRLINLFKSELEKPFIGREEEALVLTLALMTGEHAVLIGEPGTAKSALARRAADLLKARFFKYLLTRYTEPDELLGPLDIHAFREGKYVRITRNKLPEAEIAFLDEVFNASSAILNTLLTLLNERVIYDGYNEINVPLWTLIAACNNVPEEPEYQALYDRFLLRHFVKPVGEDKWGKLLDASWAIEREGYRATTPVLSMSDLKNIYPYVLGIDISRVKPIILRIFAILEDQGVHLTDRRKGKVLKVIAAHALLRNRSTAGEEDLFVLKYVAPSSREDAEKVFIVLLEEVGSRERMLRELEELEANIGEVRSYLAKTSSFDPRLLEYLRGLEKARDKLEKVIKASPDDKVVSKAKKLLSDVEEVVEEIKERVIT